MQNTSLYTAILCLVAVAGVMIGFEMGEKRARASQASGPMTPALAIPSERAPFVCSCRRGFEAIAEMYGGVQ